MTQLKIYNLKYTQLKKVGVLTILQKRGITCLATQQAWRYNVSKTLRPTGSDAISSYKDTKVASVNWLPYIRFQACLQFYDLRDAQVLPKQLYGPLALIPLVEDKLIFIERRDFEVFLQIGSFDVIGRFIYCLRWSQHLRTGFTSQRVHVVRIELHVQMFTRTLSTERGLRCTNFLFFFMWN